MGPGRNPQYTRAHSGGEAVGCSQYHVTSSSRMVAEPAVPSSTGREPRPSHQNQQWTVQLCNTASFPPAAQTVLKIVEIRKNRVQKTARGTQVKLINASDRNSANPELPAVVEYLDRLKVTRAQVGSIG